MKTKRKWVVGGAVAIAMIGGGTGLAIAAGGDDDRPLSGSALDKASAAALQETGGGTVLEAEAGDDGAAYGVEIRLDDGSVVQVTLDSDFDAIRVGSSDDDAGERGDTESGSDD